MTLFNEYAGEAAKLYTTRPDGTPNSYADSMRNIRENDPNAARRLELDIANERNKKLLQGTRPQTEIDVASWKANNFDDATIDKQLRKQQLLQDMPIDERLANIERMKAGDPYAIDDWQFAQALENGNLPYLINEYGEEAANYAIQRFHQKNQNINTITRDRQSEDLLSWKTAENMGTAVLRKGVDTVNSVVNGVDLLVNGQDAVERIANKEGLLDRASQALHDNMSDGYKNAEEKQQAKDNLRDQLQWENELAYRNKGYLKEKAQQQAKNDRQWEQISDMNDATLLAPQAAELTADLLIGGGVAKGANLVGKGIVKSAGKLAEKKAIKNIDNAIASKVASKIEPKLQAKYSGEKTASQLAQARLAVGKEADRVGVSGSLQFQSKVPIQSKNGIHQSTVTATGSTTGNKVYKGTLAEQVVANKAKNTASQVGNAIEKSRNSVVKYQSAQIAQKLKDKVTPKVLGSIRKDIDDLATTAGKVTATAGVIAHGANQEAIEAIGSTYNQMMSIEPDKLYRTVKGKHMIDSLVQEKGFNSYEEAKKDGSFMEELYKRQSQLAKETSISAYKEVFKDSAIVNALTSRAELAVGGVTNKVRGFKKYLGDTAFKQLGEITEEFVESYSGEYRPKDEINKAVGSTVYDPEKQAFALGVHGAIVAGLGTGGINTLPLGAKGVQKATKVVSNKVDSIGKKSQENASDNNLKSIVTGIDVTSTEPSNIKDKAINKVKNTFGIASQIDEETQKNLDKEFAKTETGKVAQKLDESLSNIEDENVKKYFAENTSLSHRINFLNDQFERNTKEISKLQSNQNLSEEQSKRLNHLTAYNNSIRSTLQEFQTAIDKDIDSIDHKILEEYKIKEEAFVNFQDKVDRGEITREDANIQIKAMQEAYNKHADAYTKQIDKLIQSDLYQSIYKTEFEDSVDTNTEPSQFISAKELTDLHNNNLGSASINVQKKFEEGIAKIESNNKLTATQKRQAKRKLAMGMVKAVRQIGTNSDTTLANVKEHWNNLGSVVDGIISSLNSKDYGLEPNNANTIVHLLSHIKQLADDSKNMSNKEALTLMGKYIGTKHGGYKNKGNIGLLAYVQRALDNNGKFLPEDKLRLAHFFNTQEQKLLSLKSLELEMLNSGNLDENGSVISGSFNLKNHVLKTGENTKQQDRENDVEFTSLGELRSYMNKVSKDQEDFSKFANKYLNVALKPTVKLSGSKATKNTKTTESKKAKKTEKIPSSENSTVNGEDSFANMISVINSENTFDTTKDEADDDIDAALDSFLNDGSALIDSNDTNTTKVEISKDFNLNTDKPYSFGYNGKTYTSIQEYLNENNISKDGTLNTLKGIYFSWALNDEFVFNQIQNNNNPIEFIGSTDTTKLVANVLNEMHKFIKDNSYGSLREKYKGIVAKFAPIKQTKVSTPNVKIESPVNTPNIPKGVYISNLPISAITSDNNWASTAEWIKSKYNPKFNDVYRFNGLNLFQNPKTKEITVSNVLQHKDVTITESKKQLNTQIGDSLNKDSIANEFSKYIDENTSQEEQSKEFEYIYRYAGLTDSIAKYLSNLKYTSSMFNLNGILQLMNVTQNGSEVTYSYSSELPKAMTRAFIQTLNRSRLSKGSEVYKEYTTDGVYELQIQDLSRTGEGHEYDANKTFKQSKAELLAGKDFIEPTFDMLGSLGSEKNKFIAELGKDIVKNLGISVKPNSEIEFDMKSLEFAVGVQAFQAMFDMGMLRIVRLAKYENTAVRALNEDSNITFIDHVSFKWDSPDLANVSQTTYRNRMQVKSLIRSLGFATTDLNTARELFGNLTEGRKKVNNNTLHGLSQESLALLRLKALSDTKAGKTVFPEKTKYMHGVSDKPFTAKASDIQNKTNTGQNKIALEVVQAQNNIPYVMNSNKEQTGLADFLFSNQDNQETFLSFLGVENQNEGNIDSVNKSNMSIENGYRRELDLAKEQYLSLTDTTLDNFYLKHEMMTNQRVNQATPLSPKALKIVRELVLPDTKDSNGNSIRYGFDISNLSNYLDLIDEAISLVQDTSYLSKVNTVDVTKDRYVNVTGYALALAQALGIKVENLSEVESLKKLKDLLSNSDISNMIKDISDSLTNNASLDSTNLSKAKDFGINSPRGFNALYTLAQINAQKGINSIGLFEPKLVIEADGKGNGVYNNVKQFSTHFSEGYFDNLKRTGNVTLDLITQELASGKSLEEIEGTKLLASKINKEDILRDVYEAVSDRLVSKLQNAIQYAKANAKFDINTKSLNDIFFTNGRIVDLLKNTPQTVNGESNPIYDLYSMFYTAKIIAELGGIKDLDFNAPVAQINITEIARSIAKIAVTPSNYGGQVDGITSQLFTDIKKMLKEKSNDFYNKVQNASPEESEKLTKNYINLLRLLGIEEKIDLSKHSLKDTINWLSTIPNRQETYTLLTNTLGTTMFNAINDVYGEQFATVRAIVNYDNALFFAFFSEYQDAIRNAINIRNIKNKWVDDEGNVLDPKAYNFLNEKELQNVLKSLKNVPNVATAMSSNSKLINELIHSGNSITKEAVIEYNSRKNKAAVHAIFNSKGYNEVWGIMKEEWNSFRPAGASLLVSSIVSTESLTQGRLAQELAKENIYTLDVFDGIEVNPIFRFKVGSSANRITDEIHKEVSLIGSFYEYASRTNLDEFMENLLRDPTLKDMHRFNLNSKNGKVLVNSQLLVGIQSVLSSVNFLSSFKGEDLSNMEKEVKKAESLHRQLLLNLLQQVSTQGKSNEPVEIQLTEYQATSLVNLTKLMLNTHKVIPTALKYYRDMAINAKAMKEVDNEYLPLVVNQFGGINNGYIKMPQKAEATMERFTKFLNNHPEYGDLPNLKLKSSSKVLDDFIKQDSIIQEAYEKARAKYSKQYPLVTRQGNSAKLNIENVKTINELSDALTEKFKELDNTSSETSEYRLDQQVALGVLPIVKDLANFYDKNMKTPLTVTTNRSEYISKLPEQSAKVVSNPLVNGYMHPTVGIFIEPSNLEVNSFTGLHELIHVGMDYLWGYFYMKPEVLKNNPNKVAGLRLIETVAKQFAFSFTNNSEYLKVIDFLHKQSSFNVNNAFAYTVDTVAAMAANINYVFSEEFANKASPLEVAQAKSQAMKEFLAYGLTNLNLMNQLNKLALKNKQQVYEETGFKQAWDSLKQVFNKMFNAFLSIFGYTQHNADRVDNSLLSHSVKALMVISQSNADIANNTDNIGSASINTTSFNNTTHVSTEDAIRSLGQLNGNSQDHIDNMLDIYNSVNQILEERDYRSYPEAYKDIKDNTFNQEAINDMNTLMQKGLPFTSLDENMFKLMYGINKANFENNPEYVKEATKILHNLLSNIPAKFRGNIFHEELSKLEPYSLLALVQTNENLKSSIEQYLNQDNSKLQEFRANAVYKGLNTSEMLKPTIDRLSILASKLKFDGKNSLVTQAKQLAQEAKQQSSRVKALDTINDLADDIPIKHIPTAVKFIAEEWFSGENLKHQDTNMEKALANIAKRSALLANRPTVVSKLIRLFLGAMGDTQYIYSMQNKYSILADTAKEKIGNLINASIDASFGKQLSTEEHTTLKRAFFDTGMNFIVNEGNIDIHKVLKDKVYRKDEIRRITNMLYGEYSGIDKNTLESFIQWQTDGLAEMSIKGLAKSKQQGIPSFISPNAKAIANLTLLKSIGEVSNNVNFDRASVESLANTLVALKSLEYVEQSQLNNLSDMFKNYAKGMSLLSKETNNTYNKAYGFYPDNYSGYQNYQHTKKNPNKDYEIVEPSDKDTINRLLELGYENRMALPTGELVFATNQSVASNLVNGILLFTEITVNGANQVTGKKIGDKSLTKNINKPLVQKSFKQLWDNEIKGNKSYYSNLSDLSNYSITLNHDGSIRDVEAKLENKHKQMFTQETEHSYEHVGDLQARQIEELTVQRNNLDAIQKLNQAFKNDKDKSKYVLFNGKYKAKGNSQEDIRFAQEFNNLYHMLPAGTRQEIEQMGGLYLNRVELANILGYEQASIVDIYTGKSGLPKAVQNVVKSTMSALVQAKLIKNPVTALKKSERLKAEVTSLAKDIVLNKSVIVPAANLISNIIHLWMSGIPVTDIPKLIVQGYQEVKLYNKYEGEMFLLNHQIQGGGLSVYEKQKAQLKVAQLSKLIDKLSITPLMRSGIYTNISDKEVNSESFGILDDVSKRFGLNKLENNTPEFLKNLLILRNSKAHSLMEESLNYGDFISKYTIYMHLTTKKNVDSNKALDFIRDEFVNYAMNRGREFDWANKVGLTWFLSYKLGIQRIIYRNLRRNFLRTMSVWQASDSLKAGGMDLGGLIQTVPQQRLWTDYSGYHFELDNMVDSFGSHWIERLLF